MFKSWRALTERNIDHTEHCRTSLAVCHLRQQFHLKELFELGKVEIYLPNCNKSEHKAQVFKPATVKTTLLRHLNLLAFLL
jgi:hypothetical protein